MTAPGSVDMFDLKSSMHALSSKSNERPDRHHRRNDEKGRCLVNRNPRMDKKLSGEPHNRRLAVAAIYISTYAAQRHHISTTLYRTYHQSLPQY